MLWCFIIDERLLQVLLVSVNRASSAKVKRKIKTTA